MVEKTGRTWKEDFTRCEVIIKPFSAQAVEKLNFEILNCCVLPYTLRGSKMTKNDFDSSVFVGKPIYIYTKASPFIENWKQIFFP